MPPIIPEGDPAQSLADASGDPGDDGSEPAARLRSDPAGAGRGHRTRSVPIVIDQAEELLSADDPSAFLELLRDALDADPRRTSCSCSSRSFGPRSSAGAAPTCSGTRSPSHRSTAPRRGR
ncbi:hypothetical protein [Actinomadura sp. SCN-SB]|uniref:hypothetical protein n=1 Tax=Actinomadura sp. SCN-SB TaxID=3373092 RepID=UPI003753DDA1